MDALGDELFAAASASRDGGMVMKLSSLRGAPRAVARVALRRAIAAAGGLRGVSSLHVDKILDLASSKDPSSRRLPLPGNREAFFSFRELRLGPRSGPPRPTRVPFPSAALEVRP